MSTSTVFSFSQGKKSALRDAQLVLLVLLKPKQYTISVHVHHLWEYLLILCLVLHLEKEFPCTLEIILIEFSNSIILAYTLVHHDMDG